MKQAQNDSAHVHRFLRRLVHCMTISSCFAAASHAAAESAPNPAPIAIVKRIAGPDGNWDYATADSAKRRLYVARDYGVMAIDLDSWAVTDKLVPGSMVHGIAAVGSTGRFVSTNGTTNTATLFEGSTGKVLAEIATGKDPDAVVFEPKSGLVATINHEGGDATLIDPNSRTAVGTVRIGGELEFAAADGEGHVYVNVADKHQIAVIDVAARKVTATIRLPGCKDPSGLAYDADDRWLIVVCFNGVAEFIDPIGRRPIAKIRTGKLPDAVMWDSARRRAYVPSFADGNLTVIAVRNSNDIKVVQTLATQMGTRTGAVDLSTGTVYLPTSKLTPPAKEGEYPIPVPGTFEVLVVGAKAHQT
jgi:DNA-binding beta-propeller fold protein YncE